MVNGSAFPNLRITIKKANNGNSFQYEIFALFLNTILLVDMVRLLISGSGVVSVFRDGLYIFCFIYMLYHSIIARKILVPIAMITLYSFLAVISLLVYPELTSAVLSGSLIFITRCVPAFYYARYLNNYIVLYRSLKKYYIIQVAYCIIYMLTHFGYITDGSYMTFSYNILLLTVLLLLSAINRPRPLSIIGSIFFIAIIFMYGARGPIVCIFISLFLFIIYKSRKNSIGKRVVLILAIGIIIGIIILFFDNIVALLARINPSSRTLYMLGQLQLFDSSGRESILGLLLKETENNIVLPHGLYSDRMLLANIYGGNVADYYAHNLVVEILYQFGGVLGFIVLVYLIIKYLRAYISLRRIEEDTIAIMAFSFFSGITTLLLSSSYLINERGWLSLGITFAVIGMSKSVKNKSKSATPINLSGEKTM